MYNFNVIFLSQMFNLDFGSSDKLFEDNILVILKHVCQLGRRKEGIANTVNILKDDTKQGNSFSYWIIKTRVPGSKIGENVDQFLKAFFLAYWMGLKEGKGVPQ